MLGCQAPESEACLTLLINFDAEHRWNRQYESRLKTMEKETQQFSKGLVGEFMITRELETRQCSNTKMGSDEHGASPAKVPLQPIGN